MPICSGGVTLASDSNLFYLSDQDLETIGVTDPIDRKMGSNNVSQVFRESRKFEMAGR
jgi:hypothetical protein